MRFTLAAARQLRERDHALEARDHARVVARHDQGAVSAALQQELDSGRRIAVVEARGGLICQHQARALAHRPRDGHALLLAQGELRRSRARPRSEAELLEQLESLAACVRGSDASKALRQRQILEYAEPLQQVQRLKTQPM
jgi:hypothetical protein